MILLTFFGIAWYEQILLGKVPGRLVRTHHSPVCRFKAGENIIIDKGEDEHGAYYLVTTIRRNGWRVRTKEYRDTILPAENWSGTKMALPCH